MNAKEKYERLEQLKDYVYKNKKLLVSNVIELLSVSEPTARRYIKNLEKLDGQFVKIINGVSIENSLSPTEHLFEEKLRMNAEEKKAMAKKCASLISEGQSIIIDSGTTCYFFAEELYQNNLKVITTDLRISMELSKRKNISLYSVGGEIRQGYYSIGGVMATNDLKSFNVGAAIMSADAVDLERGITNADMFEVSVKQAIRNSAKKIILLASSDKFNKQSFYYVMPVEQIDVIITDSKINKDTVLKLSEKGIEVIIV